jgi:hypothetical protein
MSNEDESTVRVPITMTTRMWSAACERAARMELSGAAYVRIAVAEKLGQADGKD